MIILPSSPLFTQYNDMQTALCYIINPQCHFNLANDPMIDSVEARVARDEIVGEMKDILDDHLWMETIQ